MMILGVVQWMQPVHGYDVRRELLSWSADKWANVQPGSIYHALRKLTDEGLLRAVATEQVGARPARTTYEVTEKGAGEFQALLRNNWWHLATPPDPFLAAFSFLPALPREEAAAALRNRATQLRAGVQQLQAALGSEWAASKPVFVGWMWELAVDKSEAEIAWCERVAKRIEQGDPYLPSEASLPSGEVSSVEAAGTFSSAEGAGDSVPGEATGSLPSGEVGEVGEAGEAAGVGGAGEVAGKSSPDAESGKPSVATATGKPGWPSAWVSR
ncbi:DNA-binding PadR family transcriptional regulator [Krasilnikovia cinnamomea]|uniref:DNA-binding PadR family transcriptional regulator n=2 Tax=Krasilnikovia cinnamomea TaxID=349313 RepID=A0A4Q7ZIZ6_9ACTN|nr:DNA-binding PadR family transcriptional regulator [Krasilnikovia cinnamomea]